jgi:hypothetical protein
VYKLVKIFSPVVPETRVFEVINTPFLYQYEPDDCATTVKISPAVYVTPEDAGPVLL